MSFLVIKLNDLVIFTLLLKFVSKFSYVFKTVIDVFKVRY